MRITGKLKSIIFPSAGSHPVQLEGVVHLPDGAGQWPATVICHPHPLGGGTMHNGVVTAVARALATRGFVVLRFNFRGVGRSDGQHDNGRGEQADVDGALDWLLSQPQVDPWRVSLVGYSFGAWVGLMHVQTEPRVMAAAAIGLVAWHYDARLHEARHGPEQESRRQFADDFLQSFTRPKLFVTGEHDSLAPLRALRNLVDRLPSPKTLHVIAGTDHFFHGYEQEVGELVAGFLINAGR